MIERTCENCGHASVCHHWQDYQIGQHAGPVTRAWIERNLLCGTGLPEWEPAGMRAEVDSQGIKCPFCGEDDFDLIGLKKHLTCYSIFTGEAWCTAFEKLEVRP